MKNVEDNNPIQDFWFAKDAEEIYIVCSRESSPPPDAYKYSNDYAYSDNFGDKDLLFLLYGLISRNYPNAKVFFYYSDDFLEKTRSWEAKNILIVGGPNSRNYVSSFGMYTALFKVIDDNDVKVKIFYPPKCKSKLNEWETGEYTKEKICVNCSHYSDKCPRQAICVLRRDSVSIKFPTFYDELIVSQSEASDAKISSNRITRNIASLNKVAISGCLKQDVGFFASFKNPYDENQKNRIVIINGIYTFGGVGVCNALNGRSNFSKKIYNKLYFLMQQYKAKDFMACFNIPISPQREVGNATIVEDGIVPLISAVDPYFYNVFISYRRKTSTNVAVAMYEDLKNHDSEGIVPFKDKIDNRNNLCAGQDYVIAIQKRLKQASVVILIIGKKCFCYDNGGGTEGSFKDEFFSSIELGKKIIPIESNDANYYDELMTIKDEIILKFGQEKFKEVQHYNAVKEADKDSLIKEIIRLLESHYGDVDD